MDSIYRNLTSFSPNKIASWVLIAVLSLQLTACDSNSSSLKNTRTESSQSLNSQSQSSDQNGEWKFELDKRK